MVECVNYVTNMQLLEFCILSFFQTNNKPFVTHTSHAKNTHLPTCLPPGHNSRNYLRSVDCSPSGAESAPLVPCLCHCSCSQLRGCCGLSKPERFQSSYLNPCPLPSIFPLFLFPSSLLLPLPFFSFFSLIFPSSHLFHLVQIFLLYLFSAIFFRKPTRNFDFLDNLHQITRT